MNDELAEIDLTEDEIDGMLAEGEPVEVTSPFNPVKRVRFEIFADHLSMFRWRLVAANGEVLATSDNAYRTRVDLHRALDGLRDSLQAALVVDSEDFEHHQLKAS